MDNAAGATGPLEAAARIWRLTHQSSLREKVFEALLLGLLGVELLERDIDFAVLHAMSDRDGYDVVIESGAIVRHIQLKATITGTATREVPINRRLADKPSGCVIWMVFDPTTRSFTEFRWFGGEPGMRMPDPGDRPVRHTRANRHGVKALRPEMCSIRLSQFERLSSIRDLVNRLFGRQSIGRAAQREDWRTLPCPEELQMFELPQVFSPAEAALIRQGFVPSGTDDRWFMFVEDDHLYCHRSWSGACIYSARLVEEGSGCRLVDCWVSRDEKVFESSGIDSDRHEFVALLTDHLLRR